MAPCGVERGQRAHAVTHQRRARDSGGIHRPHRPIGDGRYRVECGPIAVAVSRQIHCEHVPTMMCEISGLQHPCTVVLRCAVKENHRWQTDVEGSRTAVYVRFEAVDEEVQASLTLWLLSAAHGTGLQ